MRKGENTEHIKTSVDLVDSVFDQMRVDFTERKDKKPTSSR